MFGLYLFASECERNAMNAVYNMSNHGVRYISMTLKGNS